MKPLDLVSIDGLALDAALHEAAGPVHRGTVIQAHGITADMDEGGMFARLADGLASAGFTVVRFSFRGHGRSGGTQRGATIAGELLDLQAVVDWADTEAPGSLAIVAASFGAVSTCLSFPYIENRLHSLVLWNPVLDLRATFANPVLPWGVQNFGPQGQADLQRQGFLLVDDEFQLGRVMFEEIKIYEPREHFVASTVPALVIHGDQDTCVSFEIARQACSARGGCDFHVVEGSDHGFDSRQREDEAIETTIGWLERRFA